MAPFEASHQALSTGISVARALDMPSATPDSRVEIAERDAGWRCCQESASQATRKKNRNVVTKVVPEGRRAGLAAAALDCRIHIGDRPARRLALLVLDRADRGDAASRGADGVAVA